MQENHISYRVIIPTRPLGLCLLLELQWLASSKLLLRPFARDNLPILELESSRLNDQVLETLHDIMTRESMA